jgi:hypothetical protein
VLLKDLPWVVYKGNPPEITEVQHWAKVFLTDGEYEGMWLSVWEFLSPVKGTYGIYIDREEPNSTDIHNEAVKYWVNKTALETACILHTLTSPEVTHGTDHHTAAPG